jgi:hypothetical protein
MKKIIVFNNTFVWHIACVVQPGAGMMIMMIMMMMTMILRGINN